MIEKHRANLSLQQRNDFQNYINYQREKAINRKTKDNESSKKLSNFDALEHVNLASKFTSGQPKPKSRFVKHIFDSEYVKPFENKRVI